MAKCIRCGKEIDVIVREPEKVFYCRKCSNELLDMVQNEDTIKRKKNIKRYFKYFFCLSPGLYQILNGEFIKGIVYLFGSLILGVFWFLMIYFQFSMDLIHIKAKGLNIMFSVFIIINTLLIYTANLIEILEEKNEYTNIK